MESYDVVVLGTGAAGLVAALAANDRGATVGLYEKSAKVGGTTALSGGIVWLPANKYAREAGVADSEADSITYLLSLSHGEMLPDLVERFVETTGEFVEWLEARTALKLRPVRGFPDYHPERPGGLPRGGRSLEGELFPFPSLGSWAERVAGPDMPGVIVETPLGGGTGYVAPEILAERRAKGLQGRGRGLAGALLKSCLDRGIVPITGAEACRLLARDGRVCGITFKTAQGMVDVEARRGVVLATGGFEWNVELVRDFLRGPVTHLPSLPTNTGDGHIMAMKIGAKLGNMQNAWWVPVVALDGNVVDGKQAVNLVLRERSLPRSIMVNRKGERFANEAANYNALGHALNRFDSNTFDYANQPCWLLCDSEFVRLYGGFGSPPGQFPDSVPRAPTLRDLAVKLAIEPSALEATVRRWNEQVANGADADFGRGESAYDGWCGDQRHYPSKASTLGPIDIPPFYAVQIHASTLGTNGGVRTDGNGAVLNLDGEVIPGLFAAGNVAAAPTGMVYAGAGGTLGPIMVFGYIAGGSAAALRN